MYCSAGSGGIHVYICMYMCMYMFVYLTLLASFFLPSHFSLKRVNESRKKEASKVKQTTKQTKYTCIAHTINFNILDGIAVCVTAQLCPLS